MNECLEEVVFLWETSVLFFFFFFFSFFQSHRYLYILGVLTSAENLISQVISVDARARERVSKASIRI